MTTGADRLHAEGPAVSPVVWGCMRVREQFADAGEIARFLGGLLDLGITAIDSADIYGDYEAERALGAGLRALGPSARLFTIVGKGGIALTSPDNRPDHRVKHYHGGPERLADVVNRTLADLGVERLAAFLVHRPDWLADPRETADALDRLIDGGKIAAAGVSNHSTGQLTTLASLRRRPVVTNQIELSVLRRTPLTDGTLDQAIVHGFRPMIWSPIGGGRLLYPQTDADHRLVATLTEVATAYGLAGPAEAAIAWVVRHPSRPVPILGSGKLDRLRAGLKAAQTTLDRQDWYHLWQTAAGQEVD